MVAFLSRNTKNGGDQLAPGVPVRAGQLIAGRYRVEELLGCGANAIVVTARHVHLRTPVTLKILTAYTDEQLDAVKRQVKKARIASRLKGEHVARILDIGTTEDGMPFVVTPRLEGHTLAAELETRGRIPPDEAIRWVLEACEGLAEAHAAGLVHGDLKLKNLFLAKRGDARVLEILDFGMASPIEAAGDASATAWFGMPSYLAPEQIRDPSSVDARADIWALGVILHQLISGSLPFTADTVSGVLVAVCFDAAPLLAEVPYELARVVHRCLEKDADKRPATVGELANELARFLGDDGRRASERVRAALAAPPGGELDADASGSIPPMSVPNASEPLPLVKPRRPMVDRPTVPSKRVLARRRQARNERIAVGVVVAATALAAASILVSPPRASHATTEPAMIEDDTALEIAREPLDVAPLVPRSFDEPALPTPHELPSVTQSRITPPAPPAPAVRSRSVTRKQTLASNDVRLAPAPTETTTSRLPPGLPSTREPVVRPSHGAPRRGHDDRSSRQSQSPPSLPAPRTDGTYLRNLFSERK